MLLIGTVRRLEFLQQLHIFVLANMLRRPILVYGDDTVYGEAGQVSKL